jgi:hypothetical protein
MLFRILTAATLMVATSHASPTSVAVYESARLAETTEGDTTLATDPQTAFAAATDYAHWPMVFTDLKAVHVTEQQGVDAHVVLVHSDGNVDRLHFHNRPSAHTVWFEQVGGDAEVRGELSFFASDHAGTTRAHFRVYAAAHGLGAMFVNGDAVREQRQRLVRASLGQLQSYFTQRASAER